MLSSTIELLTHSHDLLDAFRRYFNSLNDFSEPNDARAIGTDKCCNSPLLTLLLLLFAFWPPCCSLGLVLLLLVLLLLLLLLPADPDMLPRAKIGPMLML